MMTAARCTEDFTGASHGLARTRMIPCRLAFDSIAHAAVLRVGQRTDRVWHFWSPSPRAALPRANSKAVPFEPGSGFLPAHCCRWGWTIGSLRLIPYGPGGNNHEAGASNWYFPSPQWQEVSFTDVGGPQF